MLSSLFISLQHSRTLCRHTTLRPQIKQAVKQANISKRREYNARDKY